MTSPEGFSKFNSIKLESNDPVLHELVTALVLHPTGLAFTKLKNQVGDEAKARRGLEKLIKMGYAVKTAKAGKPWYCLS